RVLPDDRLGDLGADLGAGLAQAGDSGGVIGVGLGRNDGILHGISGWVKRRYFFASRRDRNVRAASCPSAGGFFSPLSSTIGSSVPRPWPLSSSWACSVGTRLSAANRASTSATVRRYSSSTETLWTFFGSNFLTTVARAWGNSVSLNSASANV